MLCSEASDDKPPQPKVFLAVGVEAFVPDRLVDVTGRRWRCGERRKTARWTTVVWARILGVFVVLNFRGNGRTQTTGVFRIQGMSAKRPPCRGYGQQVACRDAEALNGALLVRRDDGSKEIKFRKYRYMTAVEIEGHGAP